MGKFIDLTDKCFGEWHVDKYVGKQMWECTCSCGKVKIINGADLRKGKSTSCGHTRKTDHTNELIDGYRVIKYNGDYRWQCECLECGEIHIIHTYFIEHNKIPKCLHGGNDARLVDISGRTFGEWHVDSYAGKGYWNCTCSCGTTNKIKGSHLKLGKTKSCGHEYSWIQKLKESDNEFKDITDKTFGEWHVDSYAGHGKWNCTCSCGEKGIIAGSHLRGGKTKSCGHNTSKFKDMLGQVFGELEVTEYLGDHKWKCVCSCGTVIEETGYNLRSERRTCCDTNKHRRIPMINKQFGELTTKKYLGGNKWLCECSCGNMVEVLTTNLQSGGTTSCGCKTYEIKYTHMKYKNNRNHRQIIAGSNEVEARKYIYEVFGDNKVTVEELSELLGLSYSSIFGTIKRLNIKDLIKISVDSKQERELYDTLRSFYTGDINIHERKIIPGYELDIYISDKKLAIEFNGNYWHSDEQKDKLYHQKKTIECIRNNIRLIHIFEYEWSDLLQRTKLQRFLRDTIETKKVIYARNTYVTDITLEDDRVFEDTYHLQGYASSSIKIGLFYEEELIGIMTFGRPRFNKDYQYELIRMCFKYGISVVGGSEKMLAYFIRKYNPTSIISYCNLSKFDGNGYLRLGFKTDKSMVTEPNYVWVNTSDNTTLNRYHTQKKKLLQKGLGEFGDTEDEIMKNMGYLKVYDSGNMKFMWEG